MEIIILTSIHQLEMLANVYKANFWEENLL